jgi:GT2 family glycosyltransferase
LFSSIIGCNMAFRRRVFERVGAFDPRFGPGGRIGTVEDTDFLYRVHQAGCRVIYSPDVLVHHNHGRRTDEDVQRRMRLYVAGHGAFYAKYILKADPVILKMACSESLAMIRSVQPRQLSWLLRGLAYGFYDRLRAALLINRASTASPYT